MREWALQTGPAPPKPMLIRKMQGRELPKIVVQSQRRLRGLNQAVGDCKARNTGVMNFLEKRASLHDQGRNQ